MSSATQQNKAQEQLAGWPVETFAALLGLDDRTGRKPKPSKFYLAKLDTDPATGASVHLDCEGSLHKRSGAPLDIDMRFSTLKLDNNYSVQHVFQIKNRLSGDGKLVIPERVTFMGRTIYNAESDGGDFNIQFLNNVFQAVQELNRTMRPPFSSDFEKSSPKNVLKILKSNNIHDIIGEDIESLFEGITADGSFDFDFSPSFNKVANDNTILSPSRAFSRARLGDRRVNTLDYEDSTREVRQPSATHKNSGTLYTAKLETSNTKTRLRQSAALLSAGPVIVGIPNSSVPSLYDVEFRAANKEQQKANPSLVERVANISFFGMSLKGLSKLQQSRALHAANLIHSDVQDGVYPRVLRHLVNARIQELAYDIAPPEKGETRVDIMRHMGNSFKKKVAGVGDQLGDCTEMMHVRTDKDGNTTKFGVMIDLGAAFAPKESEYSIVAPDITKSLPYFEDLFLTHKHFDHKDGIGPYADSEMFASPEFYARANDGDMVGKTVHGTENVILHMQKMLDRNNVPKELWPKCNVLKGHGWVHVRDPNTGRKIFSVEYSTESTRHSARTTPFRIIARDGSDVKFSMLKPGDTRFGLDLVEGHNSKIPVGKLIDEPFFSSGPASLIEQEKRELAELETKLEALRNTLDNGSFDDRFAVEKLQRQIKAAEAEIVQFKDEMVEPFVLEGRRDILEVDCTNDKQPGFAPTELDVEKNEIEVKSWFPELASLEPMISTADARLETKLRVAVQTNCHISLGGANLKDAGIISNKTGVNKDLDDPEITARYIQSYLDDSYVHVNDVHTEVDLDAYMEEYLSLPKHGKMNEKTNHYKEGKNDFIQHLAEDVKDPESAFTEEDYRAICFHILRNSSQSNVRYERQKEMEQTIADICNIDMKLGSIYLGYDSQTFAQMVEDDPSRIKMPMTGTQGTESEAEAWWPKLVSGRKIFDSNPKNRRTSRPLQQHQYFIMRGQTTIPGNESDFHEFLKQSVEVLRVPTVVASGRGFKIYNIDSAERRAHIEKRLDELGVKYDLDRDHVLTVHNMPIHASGHGYQKDNDCMIELVDPEFVIPGHCDDKLTISEFVQRMDKMGIKNNGEMVDTFTVHTYDMGEKLGDITKKVIGRILPSAVLVRQVKEWLKQYGGYSQAHRVTAIDNEGGVVQDALTAGDTVDPNDQDGVITQHFNVINKETEDRESAKRSYYQRRSPHDIETDQEYKRYTGPMTPKKGQNVPGVNVDEVLRDMGVEP